MTKKLNRTAVSFSLAMSSLLMGLANMRLTFSSSSIVASMMANLLAFTLMRTLRNCYWLAGIFMLPGWQ